MQKKNQHFRNIVAEFERFVCVRSIFFNCDKNQRFEVKQSYASATVSLYGFPVSQSYESSLL